MLNYFLKRIALIIPTLLGIMLLNFIIIQAAPGGPVDQMIAKLQGLGDSATARVSNASDGETQNYSSHGLSAETLAKIEQMYGFDKPAHSRFIDMLVDYSQLNFGESFYRNSSVIDLIKEKLPVSISLGLWSTLLVYLISIPLGIKKAISHNSRFDIISSAIITVSYAIPGFLLAIFLIVIFAGGSFLDWFPLRGLHSNDYQQLSLWGQIKDYFWHLALPLTAYTIGGFATLTMLTKNSFLDEINKQYVITARAKGLTEQKILYGHVFRNGMLIIIAGFPAAFLSMFFTGSMLIEVIFSLDGLGLLGYESVINRDYPVIFATLFIFSLLGLLLKLISDLTYILVDPRINFNAQR
ncbi:microcin C ABC transporter permease YejB [Dasania sp. GY-MA-18]|uniref:Inner membrane ABC transporter permease protein YejB n=1 Tax=Dasania phycosphaerae TaxID=2950436 RepID=A0A9J6RHQ8_9GAMM|nr:MULTISPECIES: microcin C ABC transporter permease YejB [Dasania]MCR8921778.1 microcin C ABC transporter permease YejB [Dasania sp. GY-MA-18]MCZ0864206.1 microcin C ABC transporter permease YejB [Dasania phycosphaerae]MCZ0867934.1 microcin C ABC transporter permease YejB [Dasania phycosphaerae]